MTNNFHFLPTGFWVSLSCNFFPSGYICQELHLQSQPFYAISGNSKNQYNSFIYSVEQTSLQSHLTACIFCQESKFIKRLELTDSFAKVRTEKYCPTLSQSLWKFSYFCDCKYGVVFPLFLKRRASRESVISRPPITQCCYRRYL